MCETNKNLIRFDFKWTQSKLCSFIQSANIFDICLHRFSSSQCCCYCCCHCHCRSFSSFWILYDIVGSLHGGRTKAINWNSFKYAKSQKQIKYSRYICNKVCASTFTCAYGYLSLTNKYYTNSFPTLSSALTLSLRFSAMTFSINVYLYCIY